MNFKILKLYKSICLVCQNQLYLEQYSPRDGLHCKKCNSHAILSLSPAEIKIEKVPIDDSDKNNSNKN